MNDFAIEASLLRKSFGDRPALAGLDLRVPCGKYFWLSGRNGAGKTTTIKILMGMLRADSGAACIFDTDITDPRRCMEAARVSAA